MTWPAHLRENQPGCRVPGGRRIGRRPHPRGIPGLAADKLCEPGLTPPNDRVGASRLRLLWSLKGMIQRSACCMGLAQSHSGNCHRCHTHLPPPHHGEGLSPSCGPDVFASSLLFSSLGESFLEASVPEPTRGSAVISTGPELFPSRAAPPPGLPTRKHISGGPCTLAAWSPANHVGRLGMVFVFSLEARFCRFYRCAGSAA